MGQASWICLQTTRQRYRVTSTFPFGFRILAFPLQATKVARPPPPASPMSSSELALSEDADDREDRAGDPAEAQDATPLLALSVNLAHNEVRAMVAAVFRQMSELRQQQKKLEVENEQLRAGIEQRNEDCAKRIEQSGLDAARTQRELLLAQQQNQALANRVVRIEGFVWYILVRLISSLMVLACQCAQDAQLLEVQRLEAVVATKEKVVAEMQALVEKLTNQREADARSSAAPLADSGELRHIVEDFAQRERQVYENLNYVRKASEGLQESTGGLNTQISERTCNMLV